MTEKAKSQNEILRTHAMRLLQLSKGSNFSEQDITFAMDLISFGYMIGLAEVKIIDKQSQNHLSNLGIINSEWGQTS